MAVTFASVNGKYTAFILDKDCEGWVIGEEEKKMGIKGSSTVTLFYENCKVPILTIPSNGWYLSKMDKQIRNMMEWCPKLTLKIIYHLARLPSDL